MLSTPFFGRLLSAVTLTALDTMENIENLKVEFGKQKQEVEKETDALVDAAKKDIEKAIAETQAKINESMEKYTQSAMAALDDVKARTQQTLEETMKKIDDAIERAKENSAK